MIMKRIVMLTIALLCLIGARAGECEVQSVEGGFYLGPTMPLGGYRGGENKVDISLGLSVSYNLEAVPVDVGVFMQFDCVRHRFTSGETIYADGIPVGSYSYSKDQNNRTLAIGVVGNYNFRRCSKINPFAGLGLGVGLNDVVGDRTFWSKGTSFVAIPRVGVEFWQLFRISAYATLCRTGYNNVGLTFGVSFGGRPRK